MDFERHPPFDFPLQRWIGVQQREVFMYEQGQSFGVVVNPFQQIGIIGKLNRADQLLHVAARQALRRDHGHLPAIASIICHQ
jgi:hypothetical protein